MYLCICNAVTEREVRACAAAGARSLEDLQETIGVATCCGQCADAACDLLASCHDERHARIIALHPQRMGDTAYILQSHSTTNCSDSHSLIGQAA